MIHEPGILAGFTCYWCSLSNIERFIVYYILMATHCSAASPNCKLHWIVPAASDKKLFDLFAEHLFSRTDKVSDSSLLNYHKTFQIDSLKKCKSSQQSRHMDSGPEISAGHRSHVRRENIADRERAQ